jgi:hypothetical protein
VDILRDWQRGNHNVGRPALPRPVAAQVLDSAGELLIPVKPGERVAPVIGTVAAFVILAVGLPWMLLDTDDPELGAVIFMGALWLLLTAATGFGIFLSVRALRSPGLRLHEGGFEFGEMSWGWADIYGFETCLVRADNGSRTTRLQLIVRPSSSISPELPFQPRDFSTSGDRLEDILRDWFQRYGFRDQRAIQDAPEVDR